MPKAPAIGSTGRPFSIPPSVSSSSLQFLNPATGAVVKVTRGGAFLLTLLFGCFYLAYKEVWLHAAISAVLAVFTAGLSWLVYPFFAYNVIVWSYRRKGWIETPQAQTEMPPTQPATVEQSIVGGSSWLLGTSATRPWSPGRKRRTCPLPSIAGHERTYRGYTYIVAENGEAELKLSSGSWRKFPSEQYLQNYVDAVAKR